MFYRIGIKFEGGKKPLRAEAIREDFVESQ
jgi:hypothetical protein